MSLILRRQRLFCLSSSRSLFSIGSSRLARDYSETLSEEKRGEERSEKKEKRKVPLFVKLDCSPGLVIICSSRKILMLDKNSYPTPPCSLDILYSLFISVLIIFSFWNGREEI